ncbi:hypothetical protein BKA70DRAFT_1433283 [Coprinopsis sp. MPI-PUGE-AT-0042]|nr:hypothetical protein BKA70DRAFT_1433283 [Coprinopsis sp. MPI-PUGE-AT-0042]
MPPATRSKQKPQHREPLPKSKACRAPPPDTFKSARTRSYWKDRLKNFSTDPLFLLGQQFARTVHPFAKFESLLKYEPKVAKEMEKNATTWRHLTTSKDRREHQDFLALKHLLSLEDQDPAKWTPAVQSQALKLVKRGQTTAWSTDLETTRFLLSHRFGDVLCGLGFHDDTTGRLLCPVDVDWDDENVKKCLRDSEQTISADSWPAVFYQNGHVEPQHPWDGFLRSSLLVMTFKHIFRTTEEPCQTVNLRTLVYVATLTITALSGQHTYRDGEKQRLFLVLYEYLDSRRGLVEIKDLLTWWDW